jgi:hypothetical protein
MIMVVLGIRVYQEWAQHEHNQIKEGDMLVRVLVAKKAERKMDLMVVPEPRSHLPPVVKQGLTEKDVGPELEAIMAEIERAPVPE